MENSATQLQPNFSEIELDSSEIEIFAAAYEQKFFSECKEAKDDFFYYRSGNRIFAIRKSSDETKPLGFEKVKVSDQQEPYLFAKIVEIDLTSLFESLGRSVYRKKYSSVSSFTIESETASDIGFLSLIPICNFSVRPLIKNDEVILVLTISKDYKPRFTKSEQEFQTAGIDTRDLDTKNGHLVASRANIKKYLLRTSLQSKYDNIESRLRQKAVEYEFIQRTSAYLIKNASSIGHNDLKIQKFNFLNIPNAKFEQHDLNKPVLYYHNNNTTRGFIHTALEQLRPYSFDIFSGKSLSLCAFVPESEAKQCERFLASLKDMLKTIFHISELNIEKIYVGNDRRLHDKIISEFDNKQFNLAFIFLFQGDKKQETSKSAYNKLKAKLISKQIPSQTVLIENVRANNEYTLRNIALNVYAKLGGTPWSIESDSTGEEFIIGVGSSIDRFGSRNIGFASVFDHFGSYLIGSCSQLCQINDYRQNLSTYLSNSLNEIIESRGIKAGAKVRLVFHIYKPASQKYEISAINECLEKFSDYEIEHAIVHVSYEHPYKIFKNIDQQLDRGCVINLSPLQNLLCMGGKGSTPLQITLDKRSTYKDIFELTKQVLFFSHLSHRSFVPANKPVTTTYPNLLAKLTGDLLSIHHWDPDMLHGMRDKLWFI